MSVLVSYAILQTIVWNTMVSMLCMAIPDVEILRWDV